MSNKQIFLKFNRNNLSFNNNNNNIKCGINNNNIKPKLAFISKLSFNNNNNSNNNNNNSSNSNSNNNNKSKFNKFNLLLLSSIYIYKFSNLKDDENVIKFGMNSNSGENSNNINNLNNLNNNNNNNNQLTELLDPYEAIKEIVGDNFEDDEEKEINLFKIMIRVLELGIILLPSLITFPIAFIPGANEMWWQLLLETIQFSGTCWIKFGQWISTRPDLFPELLIEKFQQLHSQCPSHSFEFTESLIKKNFNNRSIDDLFLYFDKVPMASGSVAQVHKAVTKDGKVTVVKVLHPDVKSNIKRDFFIIYSVIWAFSHIPEMKWLSLPESILEFGKSMMKQTNLELEASHLNRFNSNFKYNSEVVFPKPLYPLVSNQVLVESFEPGSPIMDFIKKNDQHNPTLAKIGLSAYMQMMLVDNFVHADLHPGNVLVRTVEEIDDSSLNEYYGQDYKHIKLQSKVNAINSKRHQQFDSKLRGLQLSNIDFKANQKPEPKLIFLDVGLVTQLGPSDKDHFIELFTEIVNGNGKEGAELLIRYAREAKCTEEEMYEFKEKMGTLFNQVQKSKLSEVHVGQFMSEILGLVREYHVKIESNFATLVMGTIVLEGLGKQLDPSLGLLKAAIPFLLKSQVFTFSDFIKNFFLLNKNKKKDEIEK